MSGGREAGAVLLFVVRWLTKDDDNFRLEEGTTERLYKRRGFRVNYCILHKFLHLIYLCSTGCAGGHGRYFLRCATLNASNAILYTMIGPREQMQMQDQERRSSMTRIGVGGHDTTHAPRCLPIVSTDLLSFAPHSSLHLQRCLSPSNCSKTDTDTLRAAVGHSGGGYPGHCVPVRSWARLPSLTPCCPTPEPYDSPTTECARRDARREEDCALCLREGRSR